MTKARDIASATTPNANAALLATFPHKNLIINGAMQVWQRGTTVDTASSGSYLCDRWRIGHSGTDGNVDIDRSTDVPSGKGFGYSQKISMDASETSLGASDLVNLQQRIEAQNLQHLAKGTSDALKVTASFWVKSSVASTYTLEIKDADNTRNISASYIINAANTWEYKTLTFAGDTSGVLNNDNGTGFEFIFWLDAGTDFTSGTFSTAWQAQDNAERVYDTTGWLESTSPEFYLTGVQLEVGDTATPFEHRSYGDELARCQRYYEINGDSSYVASSTYSLVTIRYVVQKRTYPTCTRTGIWWSGSEAGPSIDVAPARHGDKLCSVYGSSTTFVGGTFSIDAEL
jgi:hypothetical protein